VTSFRRNPHLQNEMLPVEIVLGPAWWYHHEGITFDEDFFYHPARRVEVEQKMEQALFERWGRYGLGTDCDKTLPVVGAVHLAADFLVSEMLGCEVEYLADAPPLVTPAYREDLVVSPDDAFHSRAYRRLEGLIDALKARYGRVVGDINWGGILNVALDLKGEIFFLDMVDEPDAVARFLAAIAQVIEHFTRTLARETGTTSISINRMVRHFPSPIFLHSESSNVMISPADYRRFLAGFDVAWSRQHRPFGVHYCGEEPHRYAAEFARLPHLDFLDVGWGGDVPTLRAHLPETFLSLRLSPTMIGDETPDDIRRTVRRLVYESANPWLTGICCIDLNEQVRDDQITALLDEVRTLREEYAARRFPMATVVRHRVCHN
jgi:hypothetical protein